MRSSRPSTTRAGLAAGTLLLAIGLAACGDSAAGDDASAGRDPEAQELGEPGSTEIEEPEPRLVVTTEGGGALVLDAADGTELGAFDTEGQARPAVGADGRHVLLVQADAGVTQVLDAGSYGEAHGDHSHFYLRDPELREHALEGAEPIHVVNHADRTAIFHDGDGTATIVGAAWWAQAATDPRTAEADGPHHGVAVPLEDGLLLTQPGDEGSLPDTVVHLDDDGAPVATHTCSDLHGEATMGDAVAFGCAEGVLVVDGDAATTVPYPAGAPADTKAGTVVGAEDSPLLLTNWTAQEVLAVDTEAGASRAIALPTAYGPLARTDEGAGVVLGLDGALHVLDLTSGAVTASVPAIAAWTKPESYGPPTPQLTVAEHTAYVTDPAARTVTAVDLKTGTAGTPWTLDAVPVGLAVVGAGEHDH